MLFRMEIGFVKCHGSGNEFVMIDAVRSDMSVVPLPVLARAACDRRNGIGADGMLVLVYNRVNCLYGMRMFNPDGTEAEMCGNGIRCIARLAQKYENSDCFRLMSGGREYEVARCGQLAEGVPAISVRIPVRLWSDDFAMFSPDEEFIARPIADLDENLLFTAINVGNPHIVAKVEHIDYDLLSRLGEKVKNLPHVFPHGVNVSLVEVRRRNEIFVATYERGAGITASCGTAMTSSATAMTLLGECDFDSRIDVLNRGGMVRCHCSREGGLSTMLIGNATYEYTGRIFFDESEFRFVVDRECNAERKAYEKFLTDLKARI